MTWKQVCTPAVTTAASVLGAFVLIMLLSKWAEKASPRYTSRFKRGVQRVVAEANQHQATAAQDINPAMQLIHSTRGLAMLETLPYFVSEEGVQKISRRSLSEMTHMLKQSQSQAMQQLVAQCPDTAPTGFYAQSTDWV